MDERKPIDLYADALSVAVGPYGVTVSLFLTEPPRSGAPQRAELVGRLRLSPELGRSLSDALRAGSNPDQSLELGQSGE